MIAFWLYAGLLCTVALAFLLVPQLHVSRRRAEIHRTRLNVALYRERLRELGAHHDTGALDAVQLEIGNAELARELLDDAKREERAASAALPRAVPVIAVLSVPLLALSLYLHWGALNQLESVLTREAPGHVAQDMTLTTMRLEALLAVTPESAEGWSLLGRAYMAQERATDAAQAFEHAAGLAGRPPELLGRLAEALYFAGGRQWTPQLQALTDEALAVDPQEAVSLKLAGTAAFRAGRYGEAAIFWERLLENLPDKDPRRNIIADDIVRARELAKASRAEGTPL